MINILYCCNITQMAARCGLGGAFHTWETTSRRGVLL